MTKEYGVYAKEFPTVEMNMYSYVNEDGLFSKLTSDGITTTIESYINHDEEEEQKDFEDFFADHVAKVNKMIKALGSKETIKQSEFTSYASYQMLLSLAHSVKEEENIQKRKDSIMKGMFK